MRMRLGLLTGLAAGYVLGAKAGQERYDQIMQMVRKAMGSETGQQLQSEFRDAADKVSERASEGLASVTDKAAEGLTRAGDKVSEKAGEAVGKASENVAEPQPAAGDGTPAPPFDDDLETPMPGPGALAEDESTGPSESPTA